MLMYFRANSNKDVLLIKNQLPKLMNTAGPNDNNNLIKSLRFQLLLGNYPYDAF